MPNVAIIILPADRNAFIQYESLALMQVIYSSVLTNNISIHQQQNSLSLPQVINAIEENRLRYQQLLEKKKKDTDAQIEMLTNIAKYESSKQKNIQKSTNQIVKNILNIETRKN